ncbi:MAG: MOSC domain-containing protein [Ktedonobacteraceae bacterium]
MGSAWGSGLRLIDQATTKVASAKNPRKWPNLFDYRAAFVVPPHPGMPLPGVRITLPDGAILTNEQSNLNQILSQALGREVILQAAKHGQEEALASLSPTRHSARAEAYWPDMEGLGMRNTVTDFALPEGTFFDCATIHLLTTATLDRLRELYPAGHFEARRFRPNIVVQNESGVSDFVENTWIGHTLAIGDEVRLAITSPCSRCLMTTLPQGDLPSDPGILRTAAKHNKVNVGVYASVLAGGTIRRGDPIRVEKQ